MSTPATASTPRSTGPGNLPWAPEEIDLLLTWIEAHHSLIQGRQVDWHRQLKAAVFSSAEHDHISIKRITEKMSNLKKAYHKAKALQLERGYASTEAENEIGHNTCLESKCKNFWRLDGIWGHEPFPSAAIPRPSAKAANPRTPRLLAPAPLAIVDMPAPPLAPATGAHPAPPADAHHNHTESQSAYAEPHHNPTPPHTTPSATPSFPPAHAVPSPNLSLERMHLELLMQRERIASDARTAERVAEIHAAAIIRAAQIHADSQASLVQTLLTGLAHRRSPPPPTARSPPHAEPAPPTPEEPAPTPKRPLRNTAERAGKRHK